MRCNIASISDPTKCQTEEDRAIRKLTEGYIMDKRTIYGVRAVMDARNNLANQAV